MVNNLIAFYWSASYNLHLFLLMVFPNELFDLRIQLLLVMYFGSYRLIKLDILFMQHLFQILGCFVDIGFSIKIVIRVVLIKVISSKWFLQYLLSWFGLLEFISNLFDLFINILVSIFLLFHQHDSIPSYANLLFPKLNIILTTGSKNF